jgi:hypothetical protein
VIRASAGLLAALFIASACAPQVPAAPSPSLGAAAQSPSATPSATGTRVPVASGLDSVPTAKVIASRRWYTIPDGLVQDRAGVAVEMSADAAAGQPRARLRSTGETVSLSYALKQAPQWAGTVGLTGVAPGEQTVDYLVRMRDGSDKVVATGTFLLSQPVYVVWTLDFEGDAATNDALDNTYAINRSYFAPMTIMWNPRVWTTADVSPARAEAMRQWTMNIANAGQAEVALHIHAWTDFVRAAGLAPRTSPSWAGRGDGYDVPLTAFDESETSKLIDLSLRLMAEHDMPRPTSFRGGGLFANAANLRAVAAAGFTADTSATNAGGFGALTLPWTLSRDAQPYHPSRTDANAIGDLPLLEVPNIAGNTYGYTSVSIQRVINDDLAMLPPVGAPSAVRRTLTFVSHPATIDPTERAAIEKLFQAFEPYRWDRDAGPLRYVTLAQLAKAFGP